MDTASVIDFSYAIHSTHGTVLWYLFIDTLFIYRLIVVVTVAVYITVIRITTVVRRSIILSVAVTRRSTQVASIRRAVVVDGVVETRSCDNDGVDNPAP